MGTPTAVTCQGPMLWFVGWMIKTFKPYLGFRSRYSDDNQLWFYWAHLCICRVGSYALYCVWLSVCLSVTWPKFILDKNCTWLYIVHWKYTREPLQHIECTSSSDALSLHCMHTPSTVQVHSISSWALTKAGGLTSTSSCIFFVKDRRSSEICRKPYSWLLQQWQKLKFYPLKG